MMPAAAPPALQQGMPAPMGGPPVRAADGGLMSIPIPDAMFDEPSGMSMARGGLVAFARGGDTDDGYDDGTDDGNVSFAPRSDGGGGGDMDGGGVDLNGPAAQRLETIRNLVKIGKLDPSALTTALGGNAIDPTVSSSRVPAAPRPAPPRPVVPSPPAAAFGTSGPASGYYQPTPPKPAGPPGLGASLYAAINGSKAPAGAPDLGLALYGMINGSPYKGPPPSAPPAPHPGVPPVAPGVSPTATPSSAPTAGQPRQYTPPNTGGLGGTKIGMDVSQRMGMRGGAPGGAAPTVAAAAQPAIPSLQESIKSVQDAIMDPQTKAYFDGQTDKLAKEKKEDLWTSLAQIGFGMAASKNPYFLGAVGEAGNAAMPAMQQAAAARRAEQNDVAKQQLALHQGAVTAGVQQHQNDQQNAIQQQKTTNDLNLGNAQLQTQIQVAAMNNAATLEHARITAAAQSLSDPKWMILHYAADMHSKDPKSYPTVDAAVADAAKEYINGIHPPKTPPVTIGANGAKPFDDASTWQHTQ